MCKFLSRFNNTQLDVWNRLRFSTVSNKRQRIIALDILRGLFLVVLIVDHVPWTPSFYSFVAGRSELFASAAEGFFVVSGILVGYIYGQKIVGSPRQTFKRIWKRGLLLALLSIGGTLAYSLLAFGLSKDFVGIEPWTGTLGGYFLNTFSLRYAYGWIDFLNRYAIFMFAAPFALWLVSRRKAWVVLAGSFFIWLVFRDNAYLMPFSAWQLIFMSGLVLGYYLPEIEGRIRKWPGDKKKRLFRAVIATSIATYILSVWWSIVIPFLLATIANGLPISTVDVLHHLVTYRASIWESWFSKHSLAPGRLLIGALWFTALYVLIRTYESKVVYWKYGKAVEYLGRHSLFVYVSHGIIIVTVNILLTPPAGYTNVLLNTIVVTVVLWLIYVITSRRELFDRFVTRTRHRINREDF